MSETTLEEILDHERRFVTNRDITLINSYNSLAKGIEVWLVLYECSPYTVEENSNKLMHETRWVAIVDGQRTSGSARIEWKPAKKKVKLHKEL